MRAGARVVVTACAMSLLTACQPTAGPAPSPQSRSTAATNVPTASARASANPSIAPSLSIDKVGASTSPGGFIAFAVVSNPSPLRAVDVAVDITAVDSGGVTIGRRSGRIGHILPGQREAVSLTFPVGRTLPAAFNGAITGVRWDDQISPEALEIAAVNFIQDARTPSVRVHLVDHAAGAIRVGLVAVCWDGAGNIRGGGSRTLMVAPGDPGRDFTFSVAISTVPSRCDAFGLTQS